MEIPVERTRSSHIPWRYERLWPYVALIVVTATVHLSSVGHPFISMDDPANVYANPIFTESEFHWTSLAYFWIEDYAGLYIPVTYSFWGGEALLSRWFRPPIAADSGLSPNPTVFHIGNLLLHLANTALVYLVLRRWVPGVKGPLAGALLFGIHPLHVETVSWVTESKGLLAAGFSLLAYLLYLAAVERPSGGRWYRVVATVCFLLAMLSKPTAVTLPFVVAVAEILIRRRAWREVAVSLAGWVLMGVVVVVVTQRVQSQSMLDVEPTGIIDRIRIAGDALAFYIVKLCFPSALIPDYGRTPQLVLSTTLSWFAWLLPLGLLLAVLPLRRRSIYLAAMTIFVFSLAPVLGLIPFGFQAVSTVADRYVYFALLGPSLALAAWFSDRTEAVSTLLVIGLLIVCGIQSWRQNGYWRNDRALFTRTLEVNDRSVLAANALGNVASREGSYAQAINYYQWALRIDPTSAESWFNLAASYEALGQPEQALPAYQSSLQFRPGYVKAQQAIARVLQGMGHYEQAVGVLEELVEKVPSHYLARYQLAELFVEFGELEAAEEQYRVVIEQEPGKLDGYSRLAAFLGQQGRWDEAAEMLSVAVDRAPEDADSWFNLGTAYLEAGQTEEAVGALRRAIELKPSDAAILLKLMTALEASGEPSEAE